MVLAARPHETCAHIASHTWLAHTSPKSRLVCGPAWRAILGPPLLGEREQDQVQACS